MNDKKLLCNGCGKEIKKAADMVREGIFQIQYDWGYFSGKDGERHSFCLCEDCYDRITKAFVLPVEVEEYL